MGNDSVGGGVVVHEKQHVAIAATATDAHVREDVTPKENCTTNSLHMGELIVALPQTSLSPPTVDREPTPEKLKSAIAFAPAACSTPKTCQI